MGKPVSPHTLPRFGDFNARVGNDGGSWLNCPGLEHSPAENNTLSFFHVIYKEMYVIRDIPEMKERTLISPVIKSQSLESNGDWHSSLPLRRRSEKRTYCRVQSAFRELEQQLVKNLSNFSTTIKT